MGVYKVGMTSANVILNSVLTVKKLEISLLRQFIDEYAAFICRFASLLKHQGEEPWTLQQLVH